MKKVQDIELDISEDNREMMEEQFNLEVNTMQKPNIISDIIGM